MTCDCAIVLTAKEGAYFSMLTHRLYLSHISPELRESTIRLCTSESYPSWEHEISIILLFSCSRNQESGVLDKVPLTRRFA